MECTIYTTVRRIGVPNARVRDLASYVLQQLKKDGTISIHFVGDKKIRQLNRQYRGKDKVTDVLSFAMQEGGMFYDKREPGDIDWGDIFICVPQIHRQAKKFAVTYREELYRMAVHGILHVLGYDHEQERDARVMFPLQDRLVTACLKKYA